MFITALRFDRTIPTFRGMGAWRSDGKRLEALPGDPTVYCTGHTLYLKTTHVVRAGRFVSPAKLLRETMSAMQAQMMLGYGRAPMFLPREAMH